MTKTRSASAAALACANKTVKKTEKVKKEPKPSKQIVLNTIATPLNNSNNNQITIQREQEILPAEAPEKNDSPIPGLQYIFRENPRRISLREFEYHERALFAAFNITTESIRTSIFPPQDSFFDQAVGRFINKLKAKQRMIQELREKQIAKMRQEQGIVAV
jgi:hypothetical protein